MLFCKFERVADNIISLNCYGDIPKRKHIYKKSDHNNVYYINKFFYIMIGARIIMLYIYMEKYSTINILQT